jgi:hypothetical protein
MYYQIRKGERRNLDNAAYTRVGFTKWSAPTRPQVYLYGMLPPGTAKALLTVQISV